MFRDERYKLNVYNGPAGGTVGGELFDMARDPMEESNLWNDPDHRDVRQRLLLSLLDWLTDTDARYHDQRVGEAFPPRAQWSLNNPL
jgi:hypothetical protein